MLLYLSDLVILLLVTKSHRETEHLREHKCFRTVDALSNQSDVHTVMTGEEVQLQTDTAVIYTGSGRTLTVNLTLYNNSSHSGVTD